MELILPSVEYKDSFIEAVKEFRTDDTYPLMHRGYRELSLDELERDFEKFIELKRAHARGEQLRKDWVPYTEYWLVEGKTFIGAIYLRHRLNEHLSYIGGHIGYDIRPSMRRKGYGSSILQLALPKIKELGVDRVFITCDVTNIGSRKIIEKNGGVLQDQIPNPETGVDKLRFWIDIR